MKWKFASLTSGIAVWAALLLIVTNSRPVEVYLNEVKEVSASVPLPESRDDEWRKKISEWQRELEQQPIDARVDRIWRAIPGYNGRVVDVQASLDKMKRLGRLDQKHLVYREVPPAVTLDDLGAEPIYRGNPQKRAVSFMVNVAWGNEYLEPILDTLDKYGVKTTFFLDGSWVKRNPELAKKIYEKGHEIGSHAYSHPDMSKIGAGRIRQELERTQDVIEQTLGIKPTLFAPPSGAFTPHVVRIARNEFQLKTILWTADTVDWQKPSVSVLVERIRKKLENGVLVLMHPTDPSSKGLEQLILLAKQRGLTPTTVSQVLSSNRID